MKKLIVANWKMHYGPVKAGAWIRAFRRERLPKDVDIAVAVPSVSLPAARASLGRAGIPALAAQNVFWAEEGAFTGEVSPSMLAEFGTEYCLVGHSERRANLGETDEMISRKVVALIAKGIIPIVCVGESMEDRKLGQAHKIVRAQITAAFSRVKGEVATEIVVAYEPIWAIGSGKICHPTDVKEMHSMIRTALLKKFPKHADRLRVIYGGSVSERNVAELASTTNVDGVLVGGASLDPRTFGLICRASSVA